MASPTVSELDSKLVSDKGFPGATLVPQKGHERTRPSELGIEPTALEIKQGSYWPDRRGWRYLGIGVLLLLVITTVYLKGIV